ncbi:hypothetical protein NDU88_002612 [Pleurodeles waltl]|uniref:Reverse transcriptase domain-containing protein n=1 Tax=Pleurodeles waltl TaxID=8319 RepID=A0AAV7RDW5_PLEWA|nr:hypothetical protein NDU88_002612 [Pleurodeles waltl]
MEEKLEERMKFERKLERRKSLEEAEEQETAKKKKVKNSSEEAVLKNIQDDGNSQGMQQTDKSQSAGYGNGRKKGVEDSGKVTGSGGQQLSAPQNALPQRVPQPVGGNVRTMRIRKATTDKGEAAPKTQKKEAKSMGKQGKKDGGEDGKVTNRKDTGLKKDPLEMALLGELGNSEDEMFEVPDSFPSGKGWDVDDELEETQKGLAEHFREESRKIIFRTRTENLEKDEKCNSFFFKKLHSAHSLLVELRDSKGNLQSGKQHVMRVVTDFYGELYSPKREREGLNAPFTLEELHLAATTSKRGKTPGSDGLPVELYVELWDLIGPDLLDLYEEMVGKGSMPQSLREGITLLYKQKGEKEDLKNWRPISLLNVDYKLLAKAMANRLKKVIEKIVHPDQTCGIPGQQITDSLARDTIEYVKSQKVQTPVVSLDQEKAFDRVSHEFMDRTLSALGLGDFFCDVVTAMYRNTSSTALVNGWKTDPFPVLSGVRQGCPLSPVLFICVIELLAERRQNRGIRGVIVPGSSGKGEVKCSLYMDDASVFCADGCSIKELEKTCIKFVKASGAKINSAKSETLLFCHWTPTRDPLPFPIKQDFLKILGVWFGRKSAAEKSWEERLAKTKQKLGLWSLRKLTIEGKFLVLLNETLPVLQYVAQVWPVQPRTPKAITRMIFYFIWNSKMDRGR